MSSLRESFAARQTFAARIQQQPLGFSVILHLLPGILILIFYILVGPLVVNAGYPSIVALTLAILFILVPFELGLLLFVGNRRNKRTSLSGVVLYREPIPAWQYVIYVVPLVAWSYVVFNLLFPSIDQSIQSSLFSWLPGWFSYNLSSQSLAQYSKNALVITFILLVVLNGIVGPIVEELYFRGYLLPRISRYGIGAIFINVVLFSLYHFFTPWQFFTRIVALLPMVYIVQAKKNIYIGMITHVLVNLGGLILSASLFLR
jgi:membrane protease YdiL (CAAX protease family)